MDLEKRVKLIEERNKKVEADKAWETSWSRRFIIILFTYVFIGLILASMKVKNPWMNAIIPAIAFLLSTMTLPFIKNYWKEHFYAS